MSDEEVKEPKAGEKFYITRDSGDKELEIAEIMAANPDNEFVVVDEEGDEYEIKFNDDLNRWESDDFGEDEFEDDDEDAA